MYITFVASELAPIAKVGGLADVIQGLAKELSKNHQVEIILPKYDCIDYGDLKQLKVEEREIWSFEAGQRYHNTIWSATVDNLKVFLLEPHHPRYYFSRGTIYGCPDDIDRFFYFSRAALEFLFRTKRSPDVIHIHDWPTALIAPLYKELFVPLGYNSSGILLTLHNLEHQGKCAPYQLTAAGLSGETYLVPDKMQDPHNPTLINTLKGGIEYADALTTVSPGYEREIVTPSGGSGLNTLLQKHQSKLRGILNGIDESYWNPAKDPYLVQHYVTHPAKKIDRIVEAKQENKSYLRTHLGLSQEHRPLVISITRLVTQKGPGLIEQALHRTLEKGGQFVLLGSSASPDLQKQFLAIKERYAQNMNLFISLERDEILAHILFAAADMIVIPSIFEPCGLTQLIALRYGTIPIVRRTGGLADTIFDVDTSEKPIPERNGFTFDHPDAAGVNWALDRALNCWNQDQLRWQEIMLHGMQQDFSWAHVAPDYLTIYGEIALRIKNRLARTYSTPE